MSVRFQKLNKLTHIKMATSINIIVLLSMFITGVYSIQCPSDSNERHGYWKSDGDRCVLKCLEGYEPFGCHVLRKTVKDEWNYKIPNCIQVKASYMPGGTVTQIGAAVVAGVGAVVAGPMAVAAAGLANALGMAGDTKAILGTVASGTTYAFMSTQCEVE